MESRNGSGWTWLVIGSVWNGKKRVKRLVRELPASSEGEIEAAEKRMRGDLYEKVCEKFHGSELKDIKIVVKSKVKN